MDRSSASAARKLSLEPVPTSSNSCTTEPGAVRRPSSGSRLRAMRDDKFAVAGPMADRAIALGRTQAAVDILHYPLSSVLDDVRNGRTVTDEVRELAVEYSCKLATATRDGRWIEYAFELLCVAPEPYNDEVAAMLDCAVRRVRSVSTLRIEHYLAGLTLLPVTWQRIRTGQHSEALIRMAREKRP